MPSCRKRSEAIFSTRRQGSFNLPATRQIIHRDDHHAWRTPSLTPDRHSISRTLGYT
ncbi:hypothetical protein FRAAL5431 [Frankia alni ACN14a]|uniref:Uncharacterized protein n=1 Tax=Frankia alni (strain DSM 45986 / CECT 9034 / ACN14a) TaxID=326424 RepID=Q0REP3_FRAAA|nr:hypothetical protein FRAAL5431 [Frankia alni ACN14a]